MRILVAGGTGFVGSVLCAEFDRRGHDVTALARDPSRADLDPAIQRVAGDVTEFESIVEPVADQDAVVNLVARSPLYDAPDGAHDRITRGGTENLVSAAEAAECSRFVQMSGLGADHDRSTAFLRAKADAEAIVRAADLDWTILRPSVIFGDGDEFVPFVRTLTTPYVTALPAGGRTKFQPIWVDDVVAMLADALEHGDHVGQAYDIGGPDALSLATITKLVQATTSRPPVIVPIPMALASLGLRLAGPVSFIPFGPDQARALSGDNVTSENDITALGRTADSLLPFETYLGLEHRSMTG